MLGKDHTIASGARWGVIAALAVFSLSGFLAMVSGLMRKYVVPDDATSESALS